MWHLAIHFDVDLSLNDDFVPAPGRHLACCSIPFIARFSFVHKDDALLAIAACETSGASFELSYFEV